ncbi:hypothetical protein [Caviibacterium pharyngocola]|nr:hypothetical protein [Caviibacterium pharyngocola]
MGRYDKIEIHKEMNKVAKQLKDNDFINKMLISYDNNTMIIFFKDDEEEE